MRADSVGKGRDLGEGQATVLIQLADAVFEKIPGKEPIPRAYPCGPL
jgi:hypothetical protein